jgi:hypothetical protein
MIVEDLRRYIPSIPDKITVWEAAKIAMVIRPLKDLLKDDETFL